MKVRRKLSRGTADILSLVALVGLWAIGLLVVGVDGDFPLNDDWSYARGVESYVNRGELVLDTWPAMSLISQVWIGIAYSELFGFSFETLRWSTLINSLLCVALYYLLLRRFSRPSLALFVSALLLFNPLFFSLSYTFMTEVHFLFLIMGSFYFFFRYSETARYPYLVGGAVASVLATLLRQPGILVSLSFSVVFLFSATNLIRRIAALTPFLLSLGAHLLYKHWSKIHYPELFRVSGLPELMESLAGKSLAGTLVTGFNLAMLSGLFLVPLLILLLPHLARINRWLIWTAGFIGLALGVLVSFYLGIFPSGNVFYNLGLGPRVQKGYYSDIVGDIQVAWWDGLDYLALAGMLVMTLLLISRIPFKALFFWRRQPPLNDLNRKWWMLAIYSAGYLLIAILIPVNFDRHVLPLLPVLAILLLPERSEKHRVALKLLAGTSLFLLIGFSVAATHDYLSWNRVKTNIYTYLVKEEALPPTQIDAGFELNGWAQTGPEKLGGTGPYMSWFVTRDDYIIVFEPIEGFERWKEYPFQTLLPPGTDSLYLMRKPTVSTLPLSETKQ